MPKKTEQKAKVKGADAEQKVLKKIQDGNKAAKENRAAGNQQANWAKKSDSNGAKKPFDKSGSGKKDFVGKRTFADKDGKPKAAGSSTQQPILNRRQKQKISDLIKKLRVSH